MLVSDVVNAVSSDMRQVLSPTGSDASIIIPWVDRIHKDVLHSTVFSAYNRYTTTVSVVSGTSSYTIAPTPGIRRIISVYDRTFDRFLLPYEDVGLPQSKADDQVGQPGAPKPMISAETMTQFPEYYQRLASNKLVLFPTPSKAALNGTYEVYYEGVVPTVSALGTTLTVPDDGLDIMVAGVNALAAAYLKNPEDAQFYKAQYQELKAATFNG